MYYIYHIKGVKIGVSEEPERRVNNQGYTDYEILEEHTCIFCVSDREQELQRHNGYKVDQVPYWKSRLMWPTKEGTIKGGKVAGKIAVDSGQFESMKTKESCSKGGKIGGKIAGKKTYELKIGVHNPEKRKEYSQAGIKALYEKYTAQELKEIRSKGAIKKRLLTQEQIDFVKKHYYPMINQHQVIPPDKLTRITLAKMFNVSEGVIYRASKS
jgi:hypothetical protein